MIQQVLEELDSVDNLDDFTESEDGVPPVTCDAETNTDAGEYTLREVKRHHHRHHHKQQQQQRYMNSLRSSTIRRSQTFSPACRQPPPGYVCKVSLVYLRNITCRISNLLNHPLAMYVR